MELSIVDFFDPTNKEHLQAFRYLERCGSWPEGFVPEDVECLTLWTIGIYTKIATHYLEETLGDEY